MDKKDPMTEFFGPAISTYTREMAIEDGVLVEVTGTAKLAGIKFPVAVTRTVWNRYIEWRQADTDQQAYQDQSGRLWDVVWMARHGMSGAKEQASQINFDLDCIPRDGRTKTAQLTTLKLHIGPGDQGEPVLTIMLPEED
jgi:hypothetical protein